MGACRDVERITTRNADMLAKARAEIPRKIIGKT